MKLKSLIIRVILCLTNIEHNASTENLELSFHEGQVTIIASEVPLDEILAEWSRLGNTTFINADGISSRLISVALIDVAEAKALDVLLSEVAGYLFAPRPLRKIGTSVYDPIFLMPPDNANTLRAPPLAPSSARSLQIETEELSSTGAQPGSVENLEQEEFDDLALFEQLRNRRKNLGNYDEDILDFPTFFPRDENQNPRSQSGLSSRPGVIVKTEENSSRPRRRRP